MKHPLITIYQDLLQMIAEVDAFKGQWQVLATRTPERLQLLRKIATIESVGSSTRIEGVNLFDAQVETLLLNLNSTAFKTRDEQEVAGYAEAMDLVFQAYEYLHLTENHICQLHQTLLRHSSQDERHRGAYKTLPNHLVATDADGTEVGGVFATATPFDSPREMQELVQWAVKTVDESAMHPLLIIAVFNVVFLAVHPFQNGNGRLSRVLTTLLLLRAGYEYVPYSSLERIIEENKDLYYKALRLRRTQTTLKNDAPDWLPWLGFFLRCLKKQKDNLAVKIEQAKTVSDHSLPTQSVQVINLLAEHERLTIAQMVELTGANQNTLKVRLRELVNQERILRHGKARATWYSLA